MVFDIKEITQVDDQKFTVHMILQLNMAWKEPRLDSSNSVQFHKYQPLSFDLAEYLWIPDLYMYDMKSAEVAKLFEPFSGKVCSKIMIAANEVHDQGQHSRALDG